MTPSETHHRVAIIGAGFSGLGAAIRLLQSGQDDFVVLERADDVGGCWLANSYPGVQCDVQSVVYSFSFAPNPDWSRDFAWGHEIQAYLRACADRFGVRPHLRLGTEVRAARWDDAAGRWRLETSRGALTADFLLSGHGALSAPKRPAIPGLDAFEGPVFHSAEWRHDVSLAGKRVAVVGTGASAIQIVPNVQPTVGHLDVYQRTPPWILPRPDAPVGGLKRALFRALPVTHRAARAWRAATLEARILGIVTRPELMWFARHAALRHLRRQVSDPALRARLTPDYAMGCKRILLSNDYYPALAQPNVDLIDRPIERVTARGLVTAGGEERPADALVLCTGFHVADHPLARVIHGRDGRSLAEHWSDRAEALLGMTVPAFPNLFLLATGPHTGLGHTSIVIMIEAQLEHVLKALKHAGPDGVLEPRTEAVAAYTAEMIQRLDGTVWSSGCTSFYLDAEGRNVALWPGFAASYAARASLFEARDYVRRPRPVAAAAPAALSAAGR